MWSIDRNLPAQCVRSCIQYPLQPPTSSRQETLSRQTGITLGASESQGAYFHLVSIFVMEM